MTDATRTKEQKTLLTISLLVLRYFYFPFCRSVNTLRRARKAAFDSGFNVVSTDELLSVTEKLDEHPDGWEHPCACATCRSYAND